MQVHLDEIATKVIPGALAILILDQAGWHGAKNLKVPRNISLHRCRRVRPNSTLKKTLAIHASELIIEPSLQIVRRHCRSLLLRLEHAGANSSMAVALFLLKQAAVRSAFT
jgi:hypothetical protein